MTKFKDIKGQRFGRLTVLKPTEERCHGHVMWLCECSCGNKCLVASHSLRHDGGTKSCGCISKETTIRRSITHGMSEASIYKIWRGMLARCNNPNNPGYKNYGGRGIKVCERWHSFENFYADVGDPPKGKTLDRWPNNDGNYEPTNWRWATRSEQRFNARPRSHGPCRQCWFYGHGPSGEMIVENNQNHVARVFKLHSENVSACLRGKQKTCKGWTFQWIPK